MSKAFVFPGQGSQQIGMGKALHDTFVQAREVFQEVDETLGQKLSTLMFEGDAETLKMTENTQPALMAVSMAVVRVLCHESGKPLPELASYVAGHSLGEYAALCSAGSLSLSDTASLLRKRGQAMQKAVPAGLGGMAALMGVDVEQAKEIAAAAAQGEICAAANDNANGQVVISGHSAAIDRAIALAAERGFKRSIKLPVSAPFHCALMQPAADVMKEALCHTQIMPPSVPLVPNVTATPTQDPTLIRTLLIQQVTGAVRWRESVLALKEAGVDQLVECGAGTVLAGLTKRIDKEITAVSLQSPEDIATFLTASV